MFHQATYLFLLFVCFVFPLVFQVRFKSWNNIDKIYSDSKRSWKWKWREKLLQNNLFFLITGLHFTRLSCGQSKRNRKTVVQRYCSAVRTLLLSAQRATKRDFWSGASKRFSDLWTPARFSPFSCARCFSFKAAGALWTWHLQQAQGWHDQHCLQKRKLLFLCSTLLAPEIKGQRGAHAALLHGCPCTPGWGSPPTTWEHPQPCPGCIPGGKA